MITDAGDIDWADIRCPLMPEKTHLWGKAPAAECNESSLAELSELASGNNQTQRAKILFPMVLFLPEINR